MPVCRFCGKTGLEKMLHYSTRHYAHFGCYLDRKKLSDLKPWQIEQFPFRLLKDRGLLEEARRLTSDAKVLPVDAPPPGPDWVLETGNQFNNRWVRAVD